MFILHSDYIKPKSYLKLNKKYLFSEGEQFPLKVLTDWRKPHPVTQELQAGEAQLTFASVFHDRKKPRVLPNIVLSSVLLGHLFFTL